MECRTFVARFAPMVPRGGDVCGLELGGQLRHCYCGVACCPRCFVECFEATRKLRAVFGAAGFR